MEAQEFAEAALSAVAGDGAAEIFFARHDGSKKGLVERSSGDDKGHKAAMDAAAGGKDQGEVTLAVQARRSAEARRERGLAGMRTVRRRKHGYTAMRLRPRARRRLSTARPPRVLMR